MARGHGAWSLQVKFFFFSPLSLCRSLLRWKCVRRERLCVKLFEWPWVPFFVLLVMAMATPAVDRLRSSIRVLNGKNDDLLMDFDNIFLSAKLVAEEVEKHHDASSVQDLHDATLDIARCAHTLRTYKEALDALAASYQASPEVTDFKTLLKDRVKELDHQSPFDPEKNDFIKQFEEAVWKIHHAGEPMPGQEQEEIVVMAGSQTLPNKSCPLSGKPVDQLENPVRSQRCRHIYERDAVLDYVRKHDALMQGRRRIASNACKCAAAGCPGILVEEQLVCDRSLKIEIREYMLRQQSSNVDTVADFTLLEEDDDTPLKGFGTR